MKTFKEKIKTYSFWTGLSAAVVLFCNSIAKCFGFSIDDGLIEDIIMSICGVLVALGFVCVPKSSKSTQATKEAQETEQEQTKDTDQTTTSSEK